MSMMTPNNFCFCSVVVQILRPLRLAKRKFHLLPKYGKNIQNTVISKLQYNFNKLHLALQISAYKFNLADVSAFLKVYIAARAPFNPDAWWVTPDVQKMLETHECLVLLLECAAESGNLTASSEIIAKIRELKYPQGEKEFALCIIGNGRAKYDYFVTFFSVLTKLLIIIF